MPYFVFEVKTVGSIGRKSASFMQQFEVFKEAKIFARQKRIEMQTEDAAAVKIMFADTEDEAKQKIEESRDAPILREWEK